ncbi:MAG: tetratricopeptide repeat protein [Candidatus Wallbacteria bacterium]|nr:tetratricopeptide repeat protein [Candidatus Wallbacteria bacterium]
MPAEKPTPAPDSALLEAAAKLIQSAHARSAAGPEEDRLRKALDLESSGDSAGALAIVSAVAQASPTTPEPHYQLGRLLLAGGQPGAARIALERALQMRPAHPATLRELAGACMEAGDLEAASSRLGDLRKLRPSDPQTMRRQGQVFLKLGKPEQAAAALDEYLFERYEDRRAHLELCRAHLELGRVERARAELELLGRQAPLEPEGLAMLGEVELVQGQHARAVEHLRAALEAGVGESHVKLLLARALLAQDDAAGALRALKGLAIEGPAALIEARARLVLGDARGALGTLESLTPAQAGSADAVALRADALEALGDESGALAACLQLERAGCSLAGLPRRIASLQAATGAADDARRTLGRHLEDNPSDTAAWKQSAELELSCGNAKQALLALGRAAELAPEQAGTHLRLARVWLDNGRPRRSHAAAAKAVELEPEDPAGHVVLAEAELALGLENEAEKHLAHALRLGTADPMVRRRLAGLYARQGDPERVIEHGLAACEAGLEDPALCLELARAYRLGRKSSQARHWLQRGLEKAPRDPSLVELRAELDLEEGRLAEAVEGARLALAMREGSPIATRVLGLGLARSGDGRAALGFLAATLAAHPDDVAARFELARASFDAGDDRAVTALYPDVEDFTPEQETLGLMVAKAASRSGDPASARRLLEGLARRGCESLELMELLGDALAELKDLEGAQAILGRATRRHPKAAGPWTRLASIHSGAGRRFEARQELAQARQLAPFEEELYLESAKLEVADGRPADAVAHLEAFIRMRPRDPRGHFWRGEVSAALGQSRQAEECYRRALSFVPEHLDSCLALGRLLLRQGRAGEARRLLETFAKGAEHRHEVLADLASVYISEERPREAEAYLRELVATAEGAQAGIRPLARLLLGQKRDREALAVLELSGDPELLFEHGELLRTQGERRRARLLLDRALAMGASRGKTMHAIARCHLESGEHEAARQRLEQVMSMAPSSLEVAADLARVLLEEAGMLQSDEGRAPLLERALELLERLRPKFQEDARLLLLHATCAARRGRTDDARASVERSLQLDDKAAAAHTLHGEIHLACGDRPRALESYLKALALDPGLEEAACRAIAFLEASGHIVQARGIMERVVEKRPHSRRARLALARLSSRAGDQKMAAVHWEAAGRENPLGEDDLEGLARAYLSLGRYADAERVNGARLAASPRALEPLVFAGDAVRAAGRLAEARVRYEQAARLHPQSSLPPSRLADLYRSEGRLQDALFQIRRALEIEPDRGQFHLEHGKALLELERHEAARDAFEKASRNAGEHQAEARLLLARAYRQLDNRRLAARTLEELVECHPQVELGTEALLELAGLHYERGDWPRAIEVYEQLRARPAGLDAPGRERLALCYARTGMSARATGVLRELAAGGKASAEAVLETARSYARQGAAREAVTLLAEHVAGQGPSERARLHVEMARLHHRSGDRRSAEQNLMVALQLRPEEGAVQDLAAQYLEETSQFELLRSTFARIVERYPADARALCHLGMGCLRLGQAREARDAFARAVKLDYNQFAAHAGLARSLRNQGDLSAAIDEYRKAQFLAPRSARLVFELGTALDEAAQPAAAIACFDKVLSLEPPSSSLSTAAREHLQKIRRP